MDAIQILCAFLAATCTPKAVVTAFGVQFPARRRELWNHIVASVTSRQRLERRARRRMAALILHHAITTDSLWESEAAGEKDQRPTWGFAAYQGGVLFDCRVRR